MAIAARRASSAIVARAPQARAASVIVARGPRAPADMATGHRGLMVIVARRASSAIVAHAQRVLADLATGLRAPRVPEPDSATGRARPAPAQALHALASAVRRQPLPSR